MTYWDYLIRALGVFGTPAFVGAYGMIAVFSAVVVLLFLTLGSVEYDLYSIYSWRDVVVLIVGWALVPILMVGGVALIMWSTAAPSPGTW